MTPQQETPTPPAIIFWILWFAILSGLLVIQFLAGGGIPSGRDQGEAPVLFQAIALGMAMAAMAVRFMVIPRISRVAAKLPAMIVGLALSEGIGIFGMFLVPPQHGTTKLFMLAISIACIVLFAPVYAMEKSGDSFRN
jgi:hypothetical protein